MVPYRAKPGVGFILLLACIGAAGTFMAWGLRTPPLERVWRIQIELAEGERKALSRGEFALFQEALRAHPELADDLVEGEELGLISANDRGVVQASYAYAVRKRPGTRAEIQVSLSGAPAGEEVEVAARTATAKLDGEASAASAFRFRLPDDGPFPQLIEVRLKRPKGKGGRNLGALLVQTRVVP